MQLRFIMALNGKEKNSKRAGELVGKVSNLQRFINKFSEKYETLTDKEVEILALVASGLKNLEIAEQLDISRATVQNHRSNIRKKLDIDSQADYIKYALAFGLISF